MTPKKVVPLGKPILWTDEEMDLLAEITPQDILDARLFWDAHVDPEFRGLLDAELDEVLDQ